MRIDRLASWYSPQARFEAHRPGGRLEARGAKAIAEALGDLWPAGWRVTSVQETPAPTGLTVRLERRRDDELTAPVEPQPAREAHATVRECHLIQLADDRIVAHVVYPERPAVRTRLDLSALEDRVLAGWLGEARAEEALESGHSGTRLWRFIMRGGSALVVKRLAPEESWIMRATCDGGREAALWASGTLEQLPGIIDHAVVAASLHDEPPLLVMRDRSDALAAGAEALAGSAVSARILRGLVSVHEAFRGRVPDGLCRLVDRLTIFSPPTLEREASGCDFAPKAAGRGWELFAELAPVDVGAEVLALARDPGPLVAALSAAEPTLVHADVRPANVGLLGGRVVLIDWGLATSAPPELDLAWLAWAAQIGGLMPPEQLIEGYRSAGGRIDPAVLPVALLATVAQTGCYFGFEATQQPDQMRRRRARDQLRWWVRQARVALDSLTR